MAFWVDEIEHTTQQIRSAWMMSNDSNYALAYLTAKSDVDAVIRLTVNGQTSFPPVYKESTLCVWRSRIFTVVGRTICAVLHLQTICNPGTDEEL